jgi:fimbrial chaperone protein
MRNAIKRLIQLTLLFFLSIQLSYGGGILVGRTRVIYDANKKEASLPLSNKSENKPFLIQSWIDNGDGKTRGPFVVTPPLFRLNANDENNLRISYTGGELPQDKESIFYINVRAIPSTPKNDINELRLVIKTRIKLFYRPEKLQGKPYGAYKLLTFARSGGQLLITNPSPYYVVFSYLTVGNTVLKDTDMIAPGGQLNVTLPANNTGNTVEWSAINDYGGDTTPEKRTL